jgi:hypothetical protein
MTGPNLPMNLKVSRATAAVVSAAMVILSSSISHAAVITWGTATDVVATTDVSTAGTSVGAFNLAARSADTATVAVNGVTFTGLTSPSPLTNTGAAAPNQLNGGTSGNANYNTLLNTAAFGGGTSTTMTLGGGNLVSGEDYLIQVWFVEERTTGSPALNTRVMTYGDGNGNTVNLGGTVGLLGQYAIGTFTADGPNQTLTLATNGFAQSHLTAYQIRLIPEPSVALLSALSAFALGRRRR